MKKQIVGALAAAALMATVSAGGAQAAVVEDVHMTFQSGATFSGLVTFTDNFSEMLAVTGTLTGYQLGTSGYAGTGSDTIDWIWDSGNYSSAANTLSNFLMDGTGSNEVGTWSNFIQLAINFSNPSALSFTSGDFVYGTDNYVDYVDPLVSGSIVGVPEPASWAMMLLGVLGLGSVLRVARRKTPRAVVAA